MLRQLIKSEILKGNEHDQAYENICEDQGWECSEDLNQLFLAEWDAVIESDWWERLQEERLAEDFYEEQIRQTDRADDRRERQQFINKYQ